MQCNECKAEMYKMATQAAGAGRRLEDVVQDAGAWENCVQAFIMGYGP